MTEKNRTPEVSVIERLQQSAPISARAANSLVLLTQFAAVLPALIQARGHKLRSTLKAVTYTLFDNGATAHVQPSGAGDFTIALTVDEIERKYAAHLQEELAAAERIAAAAVTVVEPVVALEEGGEQ